MFYICIYFSQSRTDRHRNSTKNQSIELNYKKFNFNKSLQTYNMQSPDIVLSHFLHDIFLFLSLFRSQMPNFGLVISAPLLPHFQIPLSHSPNLTFPTSSFLYVRVRMMVYFCRKITISIVMHIT